MCSKCSPETHMAATGSSQHLCQCCHCSRAIHFSWFAGPWKSQNARARSFLPVLLAILGTKLTHKPRLIITAQMPLSAGWPLGKLPAFCLIPGPSHHGRPIRGARQGGAAHGVTAGLQVLRAAPDLGVVYCLCHPRVWNHAPRIGHLRAVP